MDEMQLHRQTGQAQTCAGAGRSWWQMALVVGLIFLAFGQTLGHGFVSWDDQVFIVYNPRVCEPSMRQLSMAWWTPYAGLYTPVTLNIWMLLAIPAKYIGGTYGLSAMPFHLASLLVHSMSAVMVYQLLRRLPELGRGAIVGTILFALHPIQTEVIAWASDLKDLLGVCLSLGAMLAYLRPRFRPGQYTPRQCRSWYLLAGLCLWFAGLCKPGVVVVPGILWLVDWLIIGTSVRAAAIRVMPLGLLMLPISLWTLVAQRALGVWVPPLTLRPQVAASAMCEYLGKIVWPAQLCIDYGQTPLKIANSGFGPWACGVIAGLVALLLLTPQKSRRILLGLLLIFPVALIPVLGFVPFEFQRISMTADHYTYLPMLALAGLLAWTAGRLTSGIWIIGVVLAAVLGVMSFRQTSTWKDDMTLTSHPLTFCESKVALSFLGGYESEISEKLTRNIESVDAAQRPSIENEIRAHDVASEQYLRRALWVDPNLLPALRRMSSLRQRQGRGVESLFYEHLVLKESLQCGFDPRKVAINYVVAARGYLRLGMVAEASADAGMAKSLCPDLVMVGYLMKEIELAKCALQTKPASGR